MKENHSYMNNLDWEEIDPNQYLPRIKGLPNRKYSEESGRKTRPLPNIRSDLYEQFDNLREYDFTYEASRHESWWLLDSLGSFYDEQWINDVIRIIKGGKEASVYLCQADISTEVEIVVAKVFRPRSLRNLRKDYLYREGRSRLDSDGLEINDDRQARAMKKRTTYGQELMHTSWIEHEYRTLQILYKAGCDVPIPYASDHNAILMEYIGDRYAAAPTLNSVSVNRKEAKVLFDRIIQNLDLMLANSRVHGDLSSYNILYWDGEPIIIDFPQAVHPHKNPSAYHIFQRDIKRICGYFISKGIDLNPSSLAEDLWKSHSYSTTPNILWDPLKESEENEVNDLI